MPETTINMTCSQTGKTVEMRLTAGGDVKSKMLDPEEKAGELAEDQS